MSEPERPGSVPAVVEELTRIIDRAEDRADRTGYFAALYRRITVAILDAIEGCAFQDNARMRRLDVIFANRYLEALALFEGGLPPTPPWDVAFRAARSPFPIVLQHLVLGIGAHILLDLGIAAFETSPGVELAGLKEDFDHINDILEREVGAVRQELTEIWPPMHRFDWLTKVQDDLVDAVLVLTRDWAWELAGELNSADPAQRPGIIRARGDEASRIAKDLWQPGWLVRLVLLVIRFFERGSVTWKIRALASPQPGF